MSKNFNEYNTTFYTIMVNIKNYTILDIFIR